MDCTVDACGSDGACTHILQPGFCHIGKSCWAEGSAFSPCRVCLPEIDKASWTTLTGGPCEDGDLCTSGEVCTLGECAGGAPTVCTPEPCEESLGCASESGECEFATKPDGAPCGPTQVCLAGICGPGDSLPTGTVAWFDAGSCPVGWSLYAAAIGRSLVPTAGTLAGLAGGEPLASGEDRLHTHAASGQATPGSISYVGIGGEANHGPARAETLAVSVTVEPASSGLPYLQLLPCRKDDPASPGAVPSGVLLLTDNPSCETGEPPGGGLERLVVGVPEGAGAPAAFGGDTLAAVAHSHDVSGSINLGSHGIALLGGCCAGGYASAGNLAVDLQTEAASLEFPWLGLLACGTPLLGAVPGPDAAPVGVVLFASGGECPAGFEPLAAARGRLLVGAELAGEVGLTVGTPLGDKEDRTHTHGVSLSVTLAYKSVSAADGGNHNGAENGTWTGGAQSPAEASGLGFIQRLACVKSKW